MDSSTIVEAVKKCRHTRSYWGRVVRR
ncbi:hypothetical protein A2U01_0091319, partial [Trifolium medium]|nr:hypothetical protein [Trifolium medium]